MPSVKYIDPQTSEGKTRELFTFIEKRMGGRVPNMIRAMGNSPAVLEAYLNFNRAFEESRTTPALRSLLSALVSKTNGCEYTLATALAFGRREGLSDEELTAAQKARSSDPKIEAALGFAASILAKHGSISAAEVQDLRDAGYGDQDVVEIVGLVALNIFRNYFNLVAGTELDFPAAARKEFK